MILLDTHAFIWWFSAASKLSRRAAQVIQKSARAHEVCVSAISCWETAMLVARKRITFAMDVEDWLTLCLRQPEIRLVDLTPKIAVLSTRLPLPAPKDPSDRIILATAKVLGCPLVSKDEEIKAHGQVEVVW